MRKILLFLAFFIFFLPGLAFASVFRANQNIAINETIEGNVYLAGSSLMMDGTVNGDLMMAGESLSIDGNVTGDLTVAGANIVVQGDVTGDLRAFGATIFIEGKVGGEVIAFGGNVKIGKDTEIGGDINAGGGNVAIDPAAKISGKVTILQNPEKMGWVQHDSPLSQNRWLGQIFFLASILLVVGIFFGIYPKFFQEAASSGSTLKHFWPNFGLGLLLLIVSPIVAILCFVMKVGALIGILIVLAYAMMIILGIGLGGVLAGAFVYRTIKKPKKFQLSWLWALGGVVGLHVVTMVPLVGPLIALVFFVLACGTLVRTEWKFLR